MCSIEAVQAIIETIKSIDENSKRIVFKHFDELSVNHLKKQSPNLI